MNAVVCVLPSSMAGRRLTELLAQVSQKRSLVLRPPEIITIGRLPELLYQAKYPFASDLEQILCWTKVLRNMPAEVLKPLLIEVPSSNVSAPWVELAGLLSSLHRELSSDLTMFDDVVKLLGENPEQAPEVDRWKVLAKVQRAYLDELHRADLWDIQTARRYAIDKKEPKSDSDILVVGAVDLNRAQRSFLEAVRERVTILIGAPSSWGEGFDEFGTLRSGFWQDLPVELSRDQLITRTTADEAAAEVARQLAYLGAHYVAQEITLGVPDTTLVPVMTERLERVGIAARFGAGISASQTSPVRLLRAIVEYLDQGTFEALASLVRLPVVSEYLTQQSHLPADYLEQLDSYYQKTLLRSVHVAEWPEANGRDTAQRVFERVNLWLSPLRLPSCSLVDWAKPLNEVMTSVYQMMVVDLDTPGGDSLADACSKVSQAITQLSDLPETLTLDTSLKEAVGWIVQQIDKETIPPLRDPNSIEMIGWLDLSLDDAPVLLLTGIHDGTVPESVNGDAFLPNKIRTELGLMDNSRRYARDCYALHVLMRSREQLRVITNHQNVNGEPQTPSRLLLAVDPSKLAARVMELIHPPSDTALPKIQSRLKPRPVQSDLPIPVPHPDAGNRVRSMSPTDFKTYIDCPYRFYLSKILRLTTVDDRKTELEANDFGNLLHDTLALFKGTKESTCTDTTQLRIWLFGQLNHLAVKRYGKQPPPVVAVQLEQARQRLAAFAVIQTQRAAEGWVIKDTEVNIGIDKGVTIEVEGQAAMPLIGRIDRIDFHPATKRYAIWDYKTSDAGIKPLPAHWSKSSGWKQLQLPLYLHMVKAIGIDDNVSLGYINLPRATDRVEFVTADFTDEIQPGALEAASQVVRQIRANVFWPPQYDRIPDWDIFKGLCQHSVTRRWQARLEPDAQRAIVAELGAAGDASSSLLPAATPRSTSSSKRPALHAENVAVPTKQLRLDLPPDSMALSLDTTGGTVPPDWFDRTLIKASAGTGKTFSLAIRMIRLLFAKQSPEGILATTFTRKAAGEILERVLELLAEAIETKAGLTKLATQLKPLKIDRRGCIHHLSNLCANLHRLRVNTLDGFYSQLARSFALELKLPPSWTLADEFQSAKLRELAITRMFENQDRAQLRSLISQLSRGEAKRSIRQEIHQTIENGYALFRVTTPEAWSSLSIPKAPDEAAIAAAIAQVEQTRMKHSSFAAARDKMLDIFSQGGWEAFLQLTLVVNARTSGTYYKADLPSSFIDGVTELTKYALSKELASRRAQTEAAYELLANYHLQFETVKRAQRLVTFSDVSQRLADWFRSQTGKEVSTPPRPDDGSAIDEFALEQDRERHLAKVGFRIDSRIDHLLLDEFQDTSPAQWDILLPFAEAVVNPSAGHSTSFFCVGDVKQAIYGWRGGVAELFKVVRRQLKDIKENSLTQSYRSSPVVIDFVNDCFKKMLSHEKFGSCLDAARVWCEAFPVHETTKKELPGYIRLWNTVAKSKGRYSPDDSADEDEELPEEAIDQCIRDVAALNRSAPHVSIGILVRTNSELGPLMHRLREAQVEASQEGGNSLDDSAAVEVLLSLIQLSDHPGDRVAWFHLNNSPLAELLEIPPRAGSVSDEPHSPLAPRQGIGISCSPSLTLQALDANEDPCPAERFAMEVRSRLDDAGYGRTLAFYARILAPHCSIRDQQRLDQLIQTAYRYDAMATLRGRDFIDFVRENRVALSRPVAVRVMTIHQSKGLEFDAVFLPGLKKRFLGSKPAFVTRQSSPTEPPQGVMRYVNEALQCFLTQDWRDAYEQQVMREYSEALSTFYVALTRARQAIYLYAHPSDKPVQQWDSLLHSIFVAESERGKPEKVVYESGDQSWYASTKTAPETVAVVDEDRQLSPGETREQSLAITLRQPTADDYVRQRSTLKPSAATESRKISLTHLFEKSESIGAIVGTLVHRWFEEVVWLEEFQWDRQAMRALALRTLTPQEMPLIRLDDWLTAMETYLQSECVTETLSQKRYADWISASGGSLELQVTNERKLLELLDGLLLRGTIDRLVVGSENGKVVRAEILDYKTDALDPKVDIEAWMRERVEHHAPQLRLYRRVLAQQFQIDPSQIKMTLIMLSPDRHVTFE
jgi:ATP-dependent exoDNAse (exonuclease V) beta subunit